MITVLLAAVIMMSLFSACQPTIPSTTGTATTAATQSATTAPKNEKVTLTLLMSNTENRDGINALIEKIEKDLNISTEIELRPGGAEGENIVRSRLAVNESSDMHIFNSGSLMATLNPSKNFYDLKDMPFMDSFTDTYKRTVTFDGGIYGIPLGTCLMGGWLYNIREYEKLGLSVPKTWTELMDNCQKIKDAGKTAVIASFGNDWTSQLILLADYYNVQVQEPDFAEKFNKNQAKYATSPAAFRAFEKMREVFDKGFMNADYNATTLDIALKMLVEGEGVHYPMLTNQLGNIESNYGLEETNNIGFFGQPGDDPNNHGITVWIPNSIIFYKDSPRIEAALRWAEYYCRPESIEYYNTIRKPQGPSVVLGVNLPIDAYTAVKQALPYFEAGKTAPALEFITSVKGPNSPQICIAAMGGLKSAKECAEEYDRDVEKQAKQLGLPGW